MTRSRTPDARELIVLAERMGIPVDEAMRQVAQLVADVEPPAAVPAVPAPVASVAVA